MCLISKTKKVKVAKKDITCYKVLKKSFVTGLYYTPYIFFDVPHTILDGLESLKASDFESIVELKNMRDKLYGYSIADGFIHTFTSLNEAKNESNTLKEAFNDNCHIFECVIPKGCRYFESADHNEYCSKEIIFKQCVSIENLKSDKNKKQQIIF